MEACPQPTIAWFHDEYRPLQLSLIKMLGLFDYQATPYLPKMGGAIGGQRCQLALGDVEVCDPWQEPFLLPGYEDLTQEVASGISTLARLCMRTLFY